MCVCIVIYIYMPVSVYIHPSTSLWRTIGSSIQSGGFFKAFQALQPFIDDLLGDLLQLGMILLFTGGRSPGRRQWMTWGFPVATLVASRKKRLNDLDDEKWMLPFGSLQILFPSFFHHFSWLRKATVWEALWRPWPPCTRLARASEASNALPLDVPKWAN